MSASRLQKLLKLLESNNESTRKAASKQICDIATAHPSQLVSITRKVHALLYHSNWDTRVAAAATIGGLAEAFIHHNVQDLAAACSTPANGQQQALYQVHVALASFDLDRVLQKGQPLLASGGQEYDTAADSSLPLAERVAKQRQMLRERLGLGKGMEGKAFDDIINTEELVNAHDLAAALTTPTAQSTRASRAANRQRSATPEKQQASELLRCDSMSARERNKLKRKHKALQRQDSIKADAQGRAVGLQGGGAREDSPISSKLSKTGGSITPQSAAAAAAAAAGAAAGTVLSDEQAAEQDEAEWQAIDCGSWPFQRLADLLCNDILNPVWIVRHGAAAGLRELLREQAAAAAVEAPLLDNTSGWASPVGIGLRRLGVVLPDAVESASAANAAWLEDVIEHLLCVLALDRFADYVSDQVVVPVRETAAQALGAALQPTSLSTLQRVLELLSSMHKHHEWSVRHGAFTGIKYLLASRPEASGVLLPAALPVLVAGLTDKDDSVQAAAAEALVPMAPLLLTLGDEQIVEKLRDILWKLLSSMEQELSVATSSSLSLLAALCSPPAQIHADAALSTRVPVLWPFLLHNMSSVRMAAATSLERLATVGSDPAYAAAFDPAYAAALGPEAAAPGAWLKPVAGPCLRLLLQCLLTERDARVQQGLLGAWSSLLEQVQPCDLAAGLTVHDLRAMLNLIATPCGHALDISQLVIPYQGRLVPWGSNDAEEAGFSVRPTKKLKVKSEPDSLNGSSQSLSGVSNRGCGSGIGAGCLSLDPEAWPGMEDQEPAVKARLVASRAMAQLCCKLQGQEPSIIPGLLYQQIQQPGASSRMAASLVILNWLQLVAAKCRDAVLAAAVKGEAAAAAEPAVKPDPAGTAAGIKLDPEVLAKADADPAVDSQPATAAPAALGPFALSTVALSAAICAEVPEVLPDTCMAYLGAPGASMPSPPTGDPYSELAPLYGRMRRDLYALVNASLQVGSVLTSPSGIPIEQVSSDNAIAMAAVVPPEADVGDVAAAKVAVLQSATHVQLLEAYLHTSVCLVLASSVVASGRLPAKLNTVIQNLMAGLRKEPVVALQEVAAIAVAELMAGVGVRQPCPNEKLVKNLCSMVCGDPCETPSAAAAEGFGQQDDVQSSQLLCQTPSISSAQGTSTQPAPTQLAPAPDPAAATARVGAECALKAMCEQFGAGLFQQLPSLWLQMSGPFGAAVGDDGALTGDAQGIIHALQVVKAVVPSLHPSLVPSGLQLLPPICGCLRHVNAAVRLAAARCSAALAAAQAETVLPLLLKQVVPLLRGTSPVPSRLGAVEVMAQLVTQLQRQLVSYTVLLVVPLLRRMSDPVAAVRHKAALCFGSLTALLPLAQGLPLPEGLDADQRRSAEQDGEFLSQLLDNRKVEDYYLPLKLKVELRRYQQEGINWLSFLRRFGLNGVLADDMGLGKTLQATAIIACSIAERQAVAATAPAEDLHNSQQQNPAADNSNHVAASAAVLIQQADASILPSLVICPSTLVGHWAHEINKYVDESVLKPLAISGSPAERAAAAKQLQKGGCNVVIISYEALRSDAEWAAGVEWDYVILDEGHVIRSTKSKIAQAVKRLKAQHRLVLSGTPIQNSALELWSLFDFLMPGFLGGEREFNSRFGRVVNAARYSKKGSKEAEAGTLALDALHKQVMPFILRRTKAQVLQDLPPKIVTDVLCKLSPIQQQLYEDFSSSQALTEVTGVLKQQQQAAGVSNSSNAAGDGSTGERHVFSALLYLRKVCSHPLLALDWSVPAHRDACQEALGVNAQPAAEAALRALEHAPKLMALQDILVQCGLVSSDQIRTVGGSSKGCGNAAAAAELELSDGTSDSGHRLLVFAQLKGMLDLAESCLLKPLGISTLRLDGSIDASARFSVVQRFNTDPTIQVLLLTTHVGGLGLNLTAADTVVFLEHDWNPMKDLQAMDRAHRIGQTRTVNVYRLLMQDTLEERIMSLQQFKLDVANAVVNQDNVSMSAMDTGQLLDLFAAPTSAAEEQQQEQQKQQAAAGVSVADAQAVADGLGAAAAGKKRSALQTMLDSMGDLWDESQYQSEFDMKGFMQKLAKKQPQQ